MGLDENEYLIEKEFTGIEKEVAEIGKDIVELEKEIIKIEEGEKTKEERRIIEEGDKRIQELKELMSRNEKKSKGRTVTNHDTHKI